MLSACVAIACVACGGEDDESNERSESSTTGTGGRQSAGGSREVSAGPDAALADGGSGATSGASESGAAGKTTSGAACLPALARCDDAAERCCEGAICVEEDGEARCRERCVTRTDCGSLCCLDHEASGQKLCAAADLCPAIECSEIGGSCDQPGSACCEGLTCVQARSPEYAGCRKPCESANDCDSGCCVPFENAENGFCVAADLCACSGAGEPCGGVRRCCDGFACSTFDETGDFACQPRCSNDADCPTRCCLNVAGTPDSVCLPPAWCGKPG